MSEENVNYGKTDLTEIQNREPDYSHLQFKKSSFTVELEEDEQEAILSFYERGLEHLSPTKKDILYDIAMKLKNQIQP